MSIRERPRRAVQIGPLNIWLILAAAWSAEETDACFIVRDANGQALAYVYFEEEPERRAASVSNLSPR